MPAQIAQRRKERLDRGIMVRSNSIYALSSWREMGYLIAPRLILILGVLIYPLVAGNLYQQRVFSITATYALLALSFDFLANYVGLVSLGGALFTGIGAYIAAILNSYLGLPPLLTIPIATVAGALLSAILLRPALPLRGVYFAIVTLIYPMLFDRIIAALDIFGGTEGISGLDPLPGSWLEIYLPLIVLLIAFFALRRFVNSDMGTLMTAIKDNDQSVRASGIDVPLHRTYAVFIPALLGCFCGAYIAHLYAWAGMSSFALDFSILPIAATVVGGPGTLMGGMVGAFILVPLSELLRTFGTLRIVFYAFVIVLFLVFRSDGTMVFLRRKYEQFEHWIDV